MKLGILYINEKTTDVVLRKNHMLSLMDNSALCIDRNIHKLPVVIGSNAAMTYTYNID
jgi:hypothetical protein